MGYPTEIKFYFTLLYFTKITLLGTPVTKYRDISLFVRLFFQGKTNHNISFVLFYTKINLKNWPIIHVAIHFYPLIGMKHVSTFVRTEQ